MNKQIKNKVKKFLFKKGYKISKINKNPLQDSDGFKACKSAIKVDNPIIFDVGMNHGQTLNKILKVFPNSLIHGFEPSKYCFEQLEKDFKVKKNIILNNVGISEKGGVLEFNEYSCDSMNSFLNRAYGKAQIVDTYKVQVMSIDDYCKTNQISKIHILKSDTEGFELKVLQGANSMMKQNKIKFVLIELFFNVNFIGQSSVGEIFSYLEKNNFSLVKFYDFSFTSDGVASKSDALFMNQKFNE